MKVLYACLAVKSTTVRRFVSVDQRRDRCPSIHTVYSTLFRPFSQLPFVGLEETQKEPLGPLETLEWEVGLDPLTLYSE